MPYKFLLWLFSRKNSELKIVGATLAVLFILPVFAVVVFASSGIGLVSSALAYANPITKLVEIFDPNGNKVAEVQISSTWPVRGYVSDEFGSFDLFRKESRLGPHTGIDIANSFGKQGDPVTPFAQGKVIKTHDKDDNTCGKYVKIDHGNHIQSLYCHLSEVDAIEQTDIKPGDTIGLMGQTGAATGPHVHLQIEVYGLPANPRIFLTGEPEPSLP